jgi:hypothetical protein
LDSVPSGPGPVLRQNVVRREALLNQQPSKAGGQPVWIGRAGCNNVT